MNQKKPRYRKQITTIQVPVCPNCNQDLTSEGFSAGDSEFSELVCKNTPGCEYRFNNNLKEN